MREGRRQPLQSHSRELEAGYHPGAPGPGGFALSHLLRRTPRSRFEMGNGSSSPTRLRRARRVSGSFSAIPHLARNGKG
jgi:hypothetical protein